MHRHNFISICANNYFCKVLYTHTLVYIHACINYQLTDNGNNQVVGFFRWHTARTNLHSVCFSWFYSIQCHICPVDCYWRLVWTYIVCDYKWRIDCSLSVVNLYKIQSLIKVILLILHTIIHAATFHLINIPQMSFPWTMCFPSNSNKFSDFCW